MNFRKLPGLLVMGAGVYILASSETPGFAGFAASVVCLAIGLAWATGGKRRKVHSAQSRQRRDSDGGGAESGNGTDGGGNGNGDGGGDGGGD